MPGAVASEPGTGGSDGERSLMRVCQVVTYISDDGAFGGPVAVAVAQSAELARQGHTVDLWATWDGRSEVDAPGVRLHLYRVRRGRRPLTLLISPKMALALALHSLLKPWDAVHLHFGRDLVSLSCWLATRVRRRRTVLQPHGMVMPDRRPRSRLADALVVRRALRTADRVFDLTAAEREGLADVARRQLPRLGPISNGLQVADTVVLARPSREVLFLARLHPRKNVLRFAEAADALVSQGTDLVFRVVGPDEGDRGTLEDFVATRGLGDRVRYDGAVDAAEARRRLGAALLYVLPSRGEVFPMTVVEALAAGTPALVTSDCGLADGLRAADAALVVEPTAVLLAEAIRSLADDEPARVAMAARGHRYAQEHFAIQAVVRVLVREYSAAPDHSGAAAAGN